MEVDDDFGDLYSDVLLPLKPSSRPPNPNPSPPAPPAVSAAPAAGDTDDDWLLGPGASPTVDPAFNYHDEEEERLNPNPHKTETPRVSVPSPDRKIPGESTTAAQPDPRPSIPPAEPPPAIPGLAGADQEDFYDDDDSDSEDDLKIVLNDTDHGAMDEMLYAHQEEGEEEGDLVILTNGDQIGGDLSQDWGEEGEKGEAGEGKEGEKGAGTAGAPGPAKFGGFHPHHSTYKYVRPGAPAVGGPGPQGPPARPPLPAGPYPGRAGRGGFRGGFNNPWANQNRPAGLDFSLPPQKTIFDFEIESFEEKPWKHPGADLSDFFNFGMDEEKWKDYCKRLSQLKIESTMQSKIRVYESGRSEPEFDPDLPPELAAATGQNEMISDSGAHNMRSNGQADFHNNNNNNNNSQGTGGNMRPQLPTGRAILVESSYGERLPSMDTRPPRLRESDTIIEIVLQDTYGARDNNNGDVAGKTERESHEDAENDDFATESYRRRERSPRRKSSHKRRDSPSSNEEEEEEEEDSYKSSPHEKEKEKEKEKVKVKEKEKEDTHTATQEPSTKDLSNDNQSEQLVYSEPEEVNSVDQADQEEESQSQSKNSVREREEESQSQKAATRSETNRGRSRSERDDDVAPHDRLLLPKPNRVARKDINNFNNHRYNNNYNNNNMKWRGNDEMKWRGNGDDNMYYHQNQQQQVGFMHRERDFAPHHHNQHGFRGRSFERFNNRGNLGFREDEEEMRMDVRVGGGRKGFRGVYEREDVEGFRVRKREKDDGFVDPHVKRRRDEEIYNPRRERGKVEREDVVMMDRKRDRERERERDERESSIHIHHPIRVNKGDNKRHREREERERLKSKQIHEREELRAIPRNNNRNGSTSRDEARVDERERDRKLRDKQALHNNNNTNNNFERGFSRHDKDKYRDGTRRSSRASTDKRKHDDQKTESTKGSEQDNQKKILEASNSDEDLDSDSRRGRSKLERWNSHKEKDYTTEQKQQLDASSSVPNGEDQAVHLDAVERLKRRSERFKVPLHGEKEREKEKEGEGELTGQSQTEVKPERPARKRRWTGS